MVLSALSATSVDIAGAFAALAERVRPSVVEIRSPQGAGSGVIWSDDGLIVTNHHVAPADHARVVLADGRRFDATIERRNPAHDLAVLRVRAGDLPAAIIGDSTTLRPGELVIAVGNPFGVPRAVTAGVIWGPSEERGRGRGNRIAGIQAAIELRPGNSGGPLLNAAGQVIAINSMVIGPRMALSIPSHAVTDLIGQARERPVLGVTVQASPLPDGLDQPSGLLVTAVEDGSAADTAGILPGDLLLTLLLPASGASVAATTVALIEPEDLARALRHAGNEQTLIARVLRGGRVIQQAIVPVAMRAAA